MFKTELTSVQTDHSSLKVFEQSPHAIDVLREAVRRQAHASIVGSFDRLCLGFEFEEGAHYAVVSSSLLRSLNF